MEHIGIHTRLRAGKEADYERVHAEISPELDAMLRRNGIHAWHIFRNGRDLFHYVEVDDYAAFLRAVQHDPVNVAWQARMAEFLEKAHDYGSAESNTLPLVWKLPTR